MPAVPASERIQVPDSLEEATAYLYASGMTDGLPVILPTEGRVAGMIDGVSLPPSHEVAVLPPQWAAATVEAIAASAVMAGCLPQHMPVLVTATQAMATPEFSLLGVLATTGGYAVSVMLNGPIRREIDLNCSNNVFGPGRLANAVIGRAIRLIQLNIGGVVPGITDKSCLGWPGKYTLCWGENEEGSPWEPYHVEKGFEAAGSTVTLFAAGAMRDTGAGWTTSGHGAMRSLAHGMVPGHAMLQGWGNGARPFLVVGPETAHQIAADGISKAEAKEHLFGRARCRLEDIYHPDSGERLDLQEMMKFTTNLWADGTVSIADKAEDLGIVVAGGPGRQSCYFPGNGRSTPVTLRIDPAIKPR